MLVKNENFQEVDLSQIVGDILNEYQGTANVNISEEEAQIALAQMFYESSLAGNQYMLKNKNYAMPVAHVEFLSENVFKRIWKLLQEKVCSQFDEESEQKEIAEKVAEAIAELLPYKIIVKPLLQIVLFYILKYGHTVVCKIEN